MKSSRHSARAAWARCISRATRGWSALVAVKVLNAALVATPEAKTRFEREAKTISQLNHPNICTLYDVGHQDGIDYLVMEFLEGETLSDRLKNRGALPLQEFTKIGSEIAEALDKAHRAGIVHRDLKPGNVILTKSGAKLLDFGLAKPAVMGAATGAAPVPLLSAAMTMTSPNPQQSPLTQQGSLVGTDTAGIAGRHRPVHVPRAVPGAGGRRTQRHLCSGSGALRDGERETRLRRQVADQGCLRHPRRRAAAGEHDSKDDPTDRGSTSGFSISSAARKPGSRSTPPTTACRCGRRTAEKSSMSRIERARTTFI
jgi:serine/threonine protein kinase